MCSGGVDYEDLQDFLRHEALDVQSQQIAVTVVAMHNAVVVGYITYGIDSIKHEYPDAIAVGVSNHAGFSIPALRIYQLAVADRFRGYGIGSHLLISAFQLMGRLRDVLPCPQIVLEAYEDAVGFYEKFGFVRASQAAQRWCAPLVFMIAAFPSES